MALKIAIIGAGSLGFTRRSIQDILCVPELRDTEFALMDINERNLEAVERLVRRDLEASDLPAKVTATLDRREAVTDADYVYCFVRVGGLEAFQLDIDIPLKYGIDQCVGDTLCAGGIMYAQRTIPVLLELSKDIREVAKPDCLLINHSNPMAMNMWAVNHYGKIRAVGLCHGVQGGHALLAEALGVPKEELEIVCAGINHQTWYLSVKHKGRELREEILPALERHPVFSKTEKVRIDMLKRFGYFSTESNGHLSEYLPWYRKRPEEIKDWIDLSSWINGETGGYLRVCTEGRNWFEVDYPNMLEAPPLTFTPSDRGQEHGSYIIEALETGRLYRGHFNVLNRGCITNLPPDCIVEVPGYVDYTGMNIPIIGDLPLGCAAVLNHSISVQRLAVEAAVHGDDTLLRQAMLMDPLVGAVCNPPEVWQLVDEMLVAQAKWLPQYKDAIAAAERRLAEGPRLPVKEGYQGAARLKVRTPEELAQQAEAARRQATAADKAQAEREG